MDEPQGAVALRALLERLRRRTGRVGAALVVLAGLLTALVVVGVCACKSMR